MSKQTPITKAIEELKVNSIIEIRPDIYRHAINNAIQVLTDLLPYEREVIEDAYGQGDYDCGRGEFGGTPEFIDKSDYFTKTFTDNGK